jgi:hypothetical protein
MLAFFPCARLANLSRACPGASQPYSEVWLKLGKGLHPKRIGAAVGYDLLREVTNLAGVELVLGSPSPWEPELTFLVLSLSGGPEPLVA